MNYENIKTIILTILVITSTLLTWSIWTYQPNYDALENEKTVPGVLISKEKKWAEIVKPDFIFHHKNGTHFGTNHTSEMDRLLKEMRQWTFTHFENITSQVDNVSEFIYEKNSMEIVFPGIVPLDFYNKVFQVEDKVADWLEFDRIVIDFDQVTKEFGTVYFISMNGGQVYKSLVSSSFIFNIKENIHELVDENHHYAQYVLQPLTENKQMLVLANRSIMPIQNYLMDVIPTEKFRDALFRDPNFVKRNVTVLGEEYTSSSTLLSVNDENHLVLFVNAAQENEPSGNKKQLLEQSIHFVNGHGGWTGNYRYVDIREEEQTILYRLYHPEGYPIFNQNGMSEIFQVWGSSGINKYLRNNFSLGRLLESTEVELLSGIEALNILREMDSIEIEFLQDLRLGYEMSQDLEGPLVQLKPAWFYKYKDQWWVVPSSKREV